MRNYKKIRSTIIIHCILYLPLLPGSLRAEPDSQFTINNVALQINNPTTSNVQTNHSEYTLKADITFQLSKEALKALNHGISLQIDTEFQLKQPRTWLWDLIIYRTTLKQKLQYHPLSEQYIVTNLNTYTRNHFRNLQLALKFMGNIKDWPISTSVELTQSNKYISLRTLLNKESLPTPLKLSAYTNPDWQLSSPWFNRPIKEIIEWVLTQPETTQ